MPSGTGGGAIARALNEVLHRLATWEREHWIPVLHAMQKKAPAAAQKFSPASKPQRGDWAALLRVAHILATLDAFEAKSDGQAKEALALLDRRGIGAAVRKDLAKQVAHVQKGVPSSAAAVGPRTREEALSKLYSWIDDWSIVAHVALKSRRDLLTSCGLVHRRAKPKKDATSNAKPIDGR